jgi:hypothetical protein
MNKKTLSTLSTIILYIFAIIGFSFVCMYFAIKLGLTKDSGIDRQQEIFLSHDKESLYLPNASWTNTEEWKTLETAFRKDEIVINKVAFETGIPARVIFSVAAVEQLRLFFTERALFKEVFSPLKILGVQSVFSWGVMGIKQETAIQIEKNLRETESPFYLGKQFEHILNFKTDNIDKERYERITNETDRYYSYLYAALYIKQIETEWKKAGFPLKENIGVLATLYNLGFSHSKPNAHPQVGGSFLQIEESPYTFGSLAHDIYYGDKLLDIFPRTH